VIAEVAYLIGYSEPAAFHHAFKRWTAETPQAYRERRSGAATSRDSPPAGAAGLTPPAGTASTPMIL
jgi:AraC-like DNA-binding protein